MADVAPVEPYLIAGGAPRVGKQLRACQVTFNMDTGLCTGRQSVRNKDGVDV